ncbi:MAG: hypothetical protein ACOY0T_29285 [Myxococcota bacterium]
MAHAIDRDDPDHVIAVLNRNRQLKMIGVVAGIVLALGTLLFASAAMYSGDPATNAGVTVPK